MGRSPWNHRCPRSLLHLHKNHHDSKTPATATKLPPTAAKTRREHLTTKPNPRVEISQDFTNPKSTGTSRVWDDPVDDKEKQQQHSNRERHHARERARNRSADEGETNRNRAWRREKGEGTIDLTFPAVPRRRERQREGERERDWEREERECGRPMQGRGTCTAAFIPAPRPLAPRTRPPRSIAWLGCPRADGSAHRLGFAHASRPSSRREPSDPLCRLCLITFPIRKAVKWLIQIPPSSIASRVQ